MVRPQLSDLAEAASAVRESTVRRNRLIVDARERGASWKEIMEATGMSRSHVNQIAVDTNGGNLPVPRV